MSKKEEASKAALDAQERDDDEVPPAYSAIHSQGPTIDAPLDFPSEDIPPALSASSPSAPGPSQFRPIAIPQTIPDKTAPLLDAYARLLLRYGITEESWRAFVATMSAFLAARVSEQAMSHVMDVGRHVGDVPKRFSKGTVEHAKSEWSGIRSAARDGDYVGAAMGVVGGSIALPVGTALRAVGAALSLPGTAMGAVSRKPQTPRERASGYAAAANEKWLRARGLRVQLVDTGELASIAGLPATRLLDLTGSSADRTAAGQLGALNGYISELEISSACTLDLAANTLWLVISQAA